MNNLKILIVEDEVISAMFLQEYLERIGYEVIDTLSTGEEAIELVETHKPDLVLMDIMLKGNMTGIDTAKIIYPKYNIPIIYLTAYSDEDTIKKTKETGPFGYLVKPIEEHTLKATIEMAINKHREENDLKKNNNWLTTLIENVSDGLISTDMNGLIRFINNEAEKITGLKKDNIINKNFFDLIYLVDSSTNRPIEKNILFLIKEGIEIKLPNKINISTSLVKNIPVHIGMSLIYAQNNDIYGIIFTIKKLDMQTNNTSQMLKIPDVLGICSFCKKIKDDNGSWGQIETFIQRTLNIRFSHCICPECTEKYYSDLKKD